MDQRSSYQLLCCLSWPVGGYGLFPTSLRLLQQTVDSVCAGTYPMCIASMQQAITQQAVVPTELARKLTCGN